MNLGDWSWLLGVWTIAWIAFYPQPKLGSRGIVVACRAGGRYLTLLPLSRAQFLSDRG